MPFDGTITYKSNFLNENTRLELFQVFLKNLAWEHDTLILFGKKIISKRKVAWYGDKGLQYTYSHIQKTALPWTIELYQLKLLVEEATKKRYNSCLLNLYHDGEEGMGWHADNEKELDLSSGIASISLGATRKFLFKHRQTKLVVPLILENGSLLYMDEASQQNWLHSLPKSKKVKELRINLTFRKIRLK